MNYNIKKRLERELCIILKTLNNVSVIFEEEIEEKKNNHNISKVKLFV